MIIYWEIIVLSILISGSIKETDLIVCSGIIVGEGILLEVPVFTMFNLGCLGLIK